MTHAWLLLMYKTLSIVFKKNLKIYQQEVWRLITYFQSFNIIFVPRIRIVTLWTLASAVTRMMPLKNGFYIDIIYKTSIPDNVTNFCVFNGNQ